MTKPKVQLKKVRRKRPRGKVREVWMLRWPDGKGRILAETIGEIGKVTKREAEALRRDKQGKIDCGVIPAHRAARMTLAQLAEHDRESIADLRYKTLLEHDHAVAHAKRVIGCDVPVGRITRADVARLKAAMRDDYRPATIDKTVRCLRAIWNRAKRDGLVLDNPFAGDNTKWDPRDSRIFAPEEIEAMMAVAPDDWWRLFVRLLATSGLRLNEALHLRWADVNLIKGTVKVCRHDASRFTIDGRSYPLLAWSAKAKASYREIPLPPETVEELQRWKLKAGKTAFTGYLFVDLDRLAAIDRRLEAGTLRPNHDLVNNRLRRFKALQRKARAYLAEQQEVKVQEVPWREGCIHDLRDTYLTGVKGLPIDVLQRIAGHADIATTIRFYTMATERDAEAVRAAVASSGLAGPTVQGAPGAREAKTSA